jgi:peptidoglycan/xylan/chitin deacetylase (PgdA/CDA1 family)
MRMTRRSREGRQVGQLVIGLLALPLSVAPFLAYGTFTPEGRLVRDRVHVALSPPHLPKLTDAQQRAAVASAPRYAGKVMALAYHGIGSGADGDSSGDGRFGISPARFGEHLATLRAAGMHTVTAADVARAFGAGKPLPDNAVMISFDDGRADAIMWADPLLKEAGMKATMFVISRAAAEPGIYYAGWDRLRAAARSDRWDIQAHTHAAHRQQKVAGGGDLPVLTSLAPGESLGAYRERVAEDLEENSAAILAHVGRRPVAFAYPFGAYGADRTNDPGIRDVLREEVARRFVLAFHQDDQDTVPLVDTSQERVSLRRLEVENVSGLALLGLLNRAAGPATAQAPDDDPIAASPPVVKSLPPIPFVAELRQEPVPIAPAPAVPTTVTTATTVATPTTTPAAPTPATATTTTAPPTTTTTAKPATTTTRPPTTTTRPPTTTTTAKPATTTTRPPTTTTRPCVRPNGKPCTKGR